MQRISELVETQLLEAALSWQRYCEETLMEKATTPLYQTVLAIKLWLSTGTETHSCCALCVGRETQTIVLSSSGQNEASIGTSGVAGMDGDFKLSTLLESMVCRAVLRVFQLSFPLSMMHIMYSMDRDELGGHISEIPPKPSPSKTNFFFFNSECVPSYIS